MQAKVRRWKMIVRGVALIAGAGVVLAAEGCGSRPGGTSADLVWIAAPGYVISKPQAGDMCGIVVKVPENARSLDEVWQSAYWCDSVVLQAIDEGVPPKSSAEMQSRLVAMGLPQTCEVKVFAAGMAEYLTDDVRGRVLEHQVPDPRGEFRVHGVFVRLPGQTTGTAGLFMPFTSRGYGPRCEDILLFRSVEEGDSILKKTRRLRVPLSADFKPYELGSWTEDMVKLHPPLEFPEIPLNAKPK